jgi:hypothetical protein
MTNDSVAKRHDEQMDVWLEVKAFVRAHMTFFVVLRSVVILSSSLGKYVRGRQWYYKVLRGATSQQTGILMASFSFISFLTLAHTFTVT